MLISLIRCFSFNFLTQIYNYINFTFLILDVYELKNIIEGKMFLFRNITTIMNLVTCSLCNKKTDELQLMHHLVSTNHLQLCKKIKDKEESFSNWFFSHNLKENIYNLKLNKHLIFGSHILQQNYQKKTLI